MLGSQLYLGLGDDEYDNIGGLLGEPLKLVKCKTVDLEVPAFARSCSRANSIPSDLIEEGPVSEFHGFYVAMVPASAAQIVRDSSQRRDLSGDPAGLRERSIACSAPSRSARPAPGAARMIPAVRRVLVTEGGMGRLHAIISMHRPRLGEGKRAVMLAMGQVNLLKLVTSSRTTSTSRIRARSNGRWRRAFAARGPRSSFPASRRIAAIPCMRI
jgi:2,5-furandicarboxylate decarboxylase 1